MGFRHRSLEDRRDGLLREAEHIEKRLKAIHVEVTELNTRIAPNMPKEIPPCPQCGSLSIRCGCD